MYLINEYIKSRVLQRLTACAAHPGVKFWVKTGRSKGLRRNNRPRIDSRPEKTTHGPMGNGRPKRIKGHCCWVCIVLPKLPNSFPTWIFSRTGFAATCRVFISSGLVSPLLPYVIFLQNWFRHYFPMFIFFGIGFAVNVPMFISRDQFRRYFPMFIFFGTGFAVTSLYLFLRDQFRRYFAMSIFLRDQFAVTSLC